MPDRHGLVCMEDFLGAAIQSPEIACCAAVRLMVPRHTPSCRRSSSASLTRAFKFKALHRLGDRLRGSLEPPRFKLIKWSIS